MPATTCCPLALLAHNPSYLLGDAAGGRVKKILMLEPRRVAAKAAARRMASMLGERVGETAGYRVKLDTCVGPKTRIEVVTDGILIRMLQNDPGLENVGACFLDEFHERGLDGDLALTLLLDSQASLRPDLRLVVMSATLGGGLADRLAALMQKQPDLGERKGGAKPPVPVVISQGRSYPVSVKHIQRREGWHGAGGGSNYRRPPAPPRG